MLMRTDPFRMFDRLTEQAFGTATRPSAMPMDAFRHGEEFVVHFDLPGIEASGIDLTVEQNLLTVSAERSWQPAEGDDVVAAERPHGQFSRQLFLGGGLNTEDVHASYQDGVLTVRIPVAEQAKPHKVEIAAGGRAQAIDATSSAA